MEREFAIRQNDKNIENIPRFERRQLAVQILDKNNDRFVYRSETL